MCLIHCSINCMPKVHSEGPKDGRTVCCGQMSFTFKTWSSPCQRLSTMSSWCEARTCDGLGGGAPVSTAGRAACEVPLTQRKVWGFRECVDIKAASIPGTSVFISAGQCQVSFCRATGACLCRHRVRTLLPVQHSAQICLLLSMCIMKRRIRQQ